MKDNLLHRRGLWEASIESGKKGSKHHFKKRGNLKRKALLQRIKSFDGDEGKERSEQTS